MTLLLHRGPRSAAAPEGCLLIQVGAAPLFSPGRTLSIDWSDAEPRLFITEKDAVEGPFAFRADGDLFRYPLRPDWVLWTGNHDPTFVPQSLWTSGAGVYLPLQGWRSDLWKDGPILHFSVDGPMNIVLAGRAGTLRAEEGEAIPDWDDFCVQNRLASWKDSLIEAYQRRWPAREASVLDLTRWDAGTLAHLVLLRLAFPEARFFLDALPKEQSPAWRRLAQNLNIEIPRHSLAAIPRFAEPSAWGTDEFIRAFLVELQQTSPFVPKHLAEALGCAP